LVCNLPSQNEILSFDFAQDRLCYAPQNDKCGCSNNRFRVTVRVEGYPVGAHLPNSGRLEELLVLGRRVLLKAAQAPGRLTSYDLLMVDLDGTLDLPFSNQYLTKF
jgi:hypothetical protein